jgi:hypothetical protein
MHVDVFIIQLVCCRVDPFACMCSLCSWCAAGWIRARVCVHCAAGVWQGGPVCVYVFIVQLMCCEWTRARVCVHCAADVLPSGPVRVYVFIVQLMCCRVDPCACVCSLCSWCVAGWTARCAD